MTHMLYREWLHKYVFISRVYQIPPSVSYIVDALTVHHATPADPTLAGALFCLSTFVNRSPVSAIAREEQRLHCALVLFPKCNASPHLQT